MTDDAAGNEVRCYCGRQLAGTVDSAPWFVCPVHGYDYAWTEERVIAVGEIPTYINGVLQPPVNPNPTQEELP